MELCIRAHLRQPNQDSDARRKSSKSCDADADFGENSATVAKNSQNRRLLPEKPGFVTLRQQYGRFFRLRQS
ncbi:hypothetical protein [Mesorhizobium sp. A556]